MFDKVEDNSPNCHRDDLFLYRYGRQPVLWYGSILLTLFTGVMAGAPSLWVVLFARICIGFCTMLILLAAYTIGEQPYVIGFCTMLIYCWQPTT